MPVILFLNSLVFQDGFVIVAFMHFLISPAALLIITFLSRVLKDVAGKRRVQKKGFAGGVND